MKINRSPSLWFSSLVFPWFSRSFPAGFPRSSLFLASLVLEGATND